LIKNPAMPLDIYRYMNKIILIFFFLIVSAAAAQATETAAIPNLPAGLLVDQAGALADADREALEARLRAIQASGRAQVAILISGDIHGEPLSEFSLRVAEAWQLGREGSDDGLLILVIPSAGAARIEVGYGLEEVITDLRSSRWLGDLMQSIKNRELAGGLNQLLDQIDKTLPQAKPEADSADNILDAHPEWKLPFLLLVFSPFAVLPMFLGRWGSWVSGPLLAAFLGGVAWALWNSRTAGLGVAGAVLPLPYLWGLNWLEGNNLAPWQRYGRALGNLIAVAFFFSVITLFVGVGLQVAGTKEIWGAPVFAGLLSIGLAVFLFPGKPAHYLLIGLRSAMHFVFILVVAYVAMQPYTSDPTRIAFAAAGIVTAFAASALYLESREHERVSGGRRWSLWFYGLAFLAALPFMLLALVLSVLGEDLNRRIIQGAAGGGSLTGMLWLAARLGLLAAIKTGLGGRFGGGGAGSSD